MKAWSWLIGITVATVISSQAALAQPQVTLDYAKRVVFTRSSAAPTCPALADLVYSGKPGIRTVKTELPYRNLVELNRDVSDSSRLRYVDQAFLAETKITLHGAFERSTHQNSGEYLYEAQGKTCRGTFAIKDS